MSYALMLHISLPGAENPEAALNRIADSMERDNMPPTLPSVRGFMRHIDHRLVNDRTLTFSGRIDDQYMAPVLKNSHTVLLAGMIMSTMSSLMDPSNDSDVTVGVTCVNTATKRGVYYATTQFKNDAAGALESGDILAPVFTYATSEDMSPERIAAMEIAVWEQHPRVLGEAMAAYLESENAVAH